MEVQLVAFDRVSEQPAQAGAFAGLHVHLRVVEAVGVAAGRLRAVHRGVRALHQGVEVAAVLREHRDAHRHGHRQVVAVDRRPGIRERHDALDGLRDAGHGIHVGQDDGEFIAALAADGVLLAQHLDEFLRDVAQQRVAGRVPQGVVDLLELVEVDEHQGDLFLAPGGGRERLRDAIAQQHPVGQSGQRIVVREMLQLRLPFGHGPLRIEQAIPVQQLLGLAHDSAEEHQGAQGQERCSRLPGHAVSEHDEADRRRGEGHHRQRDLPQQRLAQAVVACRRVVRRLPARRAPAQQQRQDGEHQAHAGAGTQAVVEKGQVPTHPEPAVADEPADDRQRGRRRPLAQVQLHDHAGRGRGEQEDGVGRQDDELQRRAPVGVRQVERQREDQHREAEAADVQDGRPPLRVGHPIAEHPDEAEDEARAQQEIEQVRNPRKRIPADPGQEVPQQLS